MLCLLRCILCGLSHLCNANDTNYCCITYCSAIWSSSVSTYHCVSILSTGAGRMATENLAHLAAKMMVSVFATHIRVPPLAPAQAPFAFVSCARDPLHVAGFYRKLTRCVLYFLAALSLISQSCLGWYS